MAMEMSPHLVMVAPRQASHQIENQIKMERMNQSKASMSHFSIGFSYASMQQMKGICASIFRYHENTWLYLCKMYIVSYITDVCKTFK